MPSDPGSTPRGPIEASRKLLQRLWPLHLHIATIFTLLVVAAGGAIGWHDYAQTRALVLSASNDLFAAIGRETMVKFEALHQPVEMLVDLLAHQRLGGARTLAERMGSAPFVVDALAHNASLSALYVGYADGDFFLLRPLRADVALRARFHAPERAAFLVQSIEREGERLRGTYVFLDGKLAELERRDVPDYVFDARSRGWYQQAMTATQRVATAPYAFFSTGEVGLTFARRSDTGPAVVGADLTLRDLSLALQQRTLTPSTELVLFNGDGTALASSKPERIVRDGPDGDAPHLLKVAELGSAALAALMASVRPGAGSEELKFEAGGQTWRAAIKRLQDEGSSGGAYLAMLLPEDELLAEARRISRESLLITLAIVLASIPLAWVLSRLVANPLRALVDRARAVQRFDFTARGVTRTTVAEIHELATTMDAMRKTIREFLDIGATISAERNFDRLQERVLIETIAATDSSAGVIYLFDDDARVLHPVAARTGSGSATAQPVALADTTLADHPVRRAASEGRTIVTPVGYERARMQQWFGSMGDVAESGLLTIVAVPLRNRDGDVIGVLCLQNDSSDGLPQEQVSFIEALSGTAAIAIENQALLRAQKMLLESFIRLVAGAIDAKSPYTGGHCQRVPELARMLAHAACESRVGPFRDFSMSDDEWEALHIAAWLHDCGKVTTPEYVVDKATKLETIYDRLHEIRMRFEVLKRDAEIDYWKKLTDGGAREPLRAALEAIWRELDDEFALVAACNEGGEVMAAADVARLERIARRTWMRTLDDRIGLSHEERARKEGTPASGLPVAEPLLADKPEHIIARTAESGTMRENRFGFRVGVPAHRYNRGELYNLRVGRGTLTEEERYKISEHVEQTIIMLSQLPFPKHLRNVPEIAGGHHEKLDGTGYPKRLTREEMSLPARMLAIADIFEALTAADRPYKKGKTLSEAIAVMQRMRKDGHIDPDLFELFLTSGVYRAYAERFLRPSQIDDVDVSRYRSTASAA